ncbi:hypothetical protein GCM10008940_10060 [Microbulbifer agarilyticus]
MKDHPAQFSPYIPKPPDILDPHTPIVFAAIPVTNYQLMHSARTLRAAFDW